jgi:hypothetical protein
MESFKLPVLAMTVVIEEASIGRFRKAKGKGKGRV